METGLLYHLSRVARLRQVVKFRGIIPFFVDLYAESLGGRVSNGEIVGDGWTAEVTYRKVPLGPLELTETELSFEGEPDAISSFLNQFRAKVMRNAG